MPAVWGIEARLPHRVRGRRRLSTLALMAARRSHPAVSTRTRVRRLPERGVYDRSAIDAVLDAGLVAHLGFVHEDQPFVIPTLHARLGDRVYVHGSAASRTLRGLATGIPACLTVTLLDRPHHNQFDATPTLPHDPSADHPDLPPPHTVHYTRVAGRRFEGLWK